MMGLAHPAAAQAPGPAEPPSAAFLEKRVPEELATEGVVLSRTNLGLKLEQVGDKWLVSLIDLSTDRVAASTKVESLPPDREAAVAALTHVVAELSAQVVGRAERPAVLPAAPSIPAPASEHEAREVAELKFNRQSIRFGNTFLVGGGAIVQVEAGRGWKAYQGDLNEVMSPEKFYTAVGRPELIEDYRHRRRLAIGGIVVGGIIELGGIVGAFATGFDDPNLGRNLAISGTIALVGTGVFLWGTTYLARPHPIDASEAKALADKYNQGLRRNLGLPVATHRPTLRDIKLAPYTAGAGAGVVLAARF